MAEIDDDEICEQAFSDYAEPRISYGMPYAEACRKHADLDYKATKIYIIASRSLADGSPALKILEEALQGRVAGIRVGMSQHTLMSECLEIMKEVHDKDADLIVTLGGGSISDASKIIAYALANNVESKAQLLELPHAIGPKLGLGGNTNPSKIPIIAISTTLSGAEYIPFAGVTDEADDVKYQFTGNSKGPAVIILSETLALTVPVRTWLASGVRAVDHCVEALCTLKRPEKGWEEAEAAAIEGVRCLVPSLLRTKKDASNAESRRLAQLGVKHSLVPLKNRVFKGASHAIGHFLGPMGVAHGETSCILMSATHKYNAEVNLQEQKAVCKVLWDIPDAKEVFLQYGLSDEDITDLGDLLDAFVKELGLPRSLSEVGVTGLEKLATLAQKSLKDPYARTNPIPLTTPEQVMEILQLCK
ncbi:MAG: hypothetical protein Q9170_007633 [Blastenia crenularia]